MEGNIKGGAYEIMHEDRFGDDDPDKAMMKKGIFSSDEEFIPEEK